MQLTSSAFDNGQTIPQLYSCQGEDVSPPLAFVGVPDGTKSLALIMDDPDVPPSVRKDGMWVHWVVFNMEPSRAKIEQDIGLFATSGVNTGGKLGYMGPCPPDREHRYFFKLYALETLLDLKEGAAKEQLVEAMQGHILEEAQLMGRFEKS